MRYSQALLDSRLLDKFRSNANFHTACDFLNKEFKNIELDASENEEDITIWDEDDFLGCLYFGADFKIIVVELCDRKPIIFNLDNQFDSANEYD